VIVIATAWGSKFGGVNSFSTDLCRALAQTLTEHRLVCICAKASDADRDDAQQCGVTLISMDGFLEPTVGPMVADKLIEALRRADILSVDWWVGHDSITGALALDCKQQWKDSRCAVVMHMSYQDY